MVVMVGFWSPLVFWWLVFEWRVQLGAGDAGVMGVELL
jgi:hypothetical protein